MKSIRRHFRLFFFLFISGFRNKADFFFLPCFPSLCTSVEAAGLSALWVVYSLPMQLKEITWKNSAYSRLLTVHTLIMAAAGDLLLVL